MDDEHRWSRLYSTESHLRNRFSLLRQQSYNILPLGDAIQRLYAGSLPPRSVAITFDDGFYDFYVKAYPILKEFGFHATLYLTTYYCFFQRPVFDPITSYLLWKGIGRRVNLRGVFGDGSVTIPMDPPGRTILHEKIMAHALAKQLSAQEKDQLSRQLANEIGVDYENILARRLLHIMTPAEIACLDPNNVSVQLHTHRHRTPQDRTLFLREIKDNREAIKAMRPNKEELRHFCYPSGVHCNMFGEWLSQSGIASATTCDRNIATPDTHPLFIPRICDDMTVPEIVFEGWMCGVAGYLSNLRGVRSLTT